MDSRRSCRNAAHRTLRGGLISAISAPGTQCDLRPDGSGVSSPPGLRFLFPPGVRFREWNPSGTHPGETREPQDSWRIVLKKMQNLRSCHVRMKLAFSRAAVLGCHRVLKSAES